MIIKINGREISKERPAAPAPEVRRLRIIEETDPRVRFLERLRPIIMSGLITLPNNAPIVKKLWPLALNVQEFALIAGIVVSMIGLAIYILGDPSGKEKVAMALKGFIGMFVLPLLFFAIWDAFRG